ncbi:MAG: aminotransferase class I/II-fold pyridoxal phosphate-dependent enzyme [Deltaproteobacteria bacterium]|nr:aminotransferase class I/II-fold pyridoxal phosphate-dependent enzyme [Deltaproteobacteria bacterium]
MSQVQAFSDTLFFSESFGIRAHPVPLESDLWNLDAFLSEATGGETGLVYLASPNNPTGTGFTHSQVDSFLRALPPDITVVLDLAYAEFGTDPDAPRMVDLVREFANLIACRTFSKAYGLAALRLGYALAQPQRIAAMKKLRTPFAANGPALAAAEAALADDDHLRRSVALAQDGVRWWTEKLRGLGLTVTPSRANFVLVRLGRDAKPVYEALLDRGIIVRHLGAFGLPDALRITAGTAGQNERAFSALAEVL